MIILLHPQLTCTCIASIKYLYYYFITEIDRLSLYTCNILLFVQMRKSMRINPPTVLAAVL